jgi:hypothetical protein
MHLPKQLPCIARSTSRGARAPGGGVAPTVITPAELALMIAGLVPAEVAAITGYVNNYNVAIGAGNVDNADAELNNLRFHAMLGRPNITPVVNREAGVVAAQRAALIAPIANAALGVGGGAGGIGGIIGGYAS